MDVQQAVAGGLALPTLLRRIAEAACEIVGARYGALGVLGGDGRLSEFVTVGLDEHTVMHVGHLPHEEGLLGRLLADPRPVRVDDVRRHPDAVGTPPGHPSMSSFLGVPVRFGEEVFGNLYVADTTVGAFTAEDENLLAALAAAAAVAVQSARLGEVARRRREWLDAAARTARDVLADASTDDAEPLALVATRVRRAVQADAAVVLLPAAAGSDAVSVAVADGVGAGAAAGARIPGGRALAERAVSTGSETPEEPAAALRAALPGAVRFVSSLVAPLGHEGPDARQRWLLLSRVVGGRPFDDEERQMVGCFIDHVRLALEVAPARDTAQEVDRRLRDQQQATRDLHYGLLQQVLSATDAVTRLGVATYEPATRAGLQQLLARLDGIIAEVRSTF